MEYHKTRKKYVTALPVFSLQLHFHANSSEILTRFVLCVTTGLLSVTLFQPLRVLVDVMRREGWGLL
jgi:hypothetical protein